MKIAVQTCWSGGDTFTFRALICGGLLIESRDGVWRRENAIDMLNLLDAELGNVDGYKRENVRFDHV